ncbi:MAG: nitroreductase family deazaflavin-dependent oxidoreductase [Actinomycetales bacterium]|nr:nitroreductase family deazaflavin-dependent oxidoreductase [Actinomycetales bacterium]
MPELRQPPTGLTRWFFRAPIGLYRAHLGWLMGGRFVLIEHIGRKSGQVRTVVVEVVRRDPATGAVVVSSGWGEKSQWLQNLQAHPDVTIQVGSTRMDVRAHRLSPEEGEAEMLDYARRHPKAAARLSGYMGFSSDGSEATYREVGRTLPYIRFDPR